MRSWLGRFPLPGGVICIYLGPDFEPHFHPPGAYGFKGFAGAGLGVRAIMFCYGAFNILFGVASRSLHPPALGLGPRTLPPIPRGGTSRVPDGAPTFHAAFLEIVALTWPCALRGVPSLGVGLLDILAYAFAAKLAVLLDFPGTRPAHQLLFEAFFAFHSAIIYIFDLGLEEVAVAPLVDVVLAHRLSAAFIAS